MGSTGQRYTDDERRLMVEAMERDVARRGASEPDYTGLSRTLGPDAGTLKRWWLRRDAPPPEPAAATGPTDDERVLAAWLLHHEDDDAVADALVARGLALARESRAEKSYTAAAKAEADVARTVREFRARKPKGQTGPLSPEEEIERVCQMPEVLLGAWLRSPELWSDERWTAAREGT